MAKLKLNDNEILASRVPKAATLDLRPGIKCCLQMGFNLGSMQFFQVLPLTCAILRLLSTSINELRVWDVTSLLQAKAPVASCAH